MLLYISRAWWRWSDDHLLIDEEHIVRREKRILQMTAEEYYQLGNQYRKQGNWQEAMNSYMEAIALDPDSPAVVAKQMLDDILNYYCKDMYNP